MNDRERLVKVLEELDLPTGQYVISGSAVMVLHGLERPRPMGDLDIFCATRLFFNMLLSGGYSEGTNWALWTPDPNDRASCCDPAKLYKSYHGLQVDIMSDWRHRPVRNIDVAWWIYNAENVDGWPCLSLQLLLDWKVSLGRAKDRQDIPILQAALGS